MFFCDLEPLIHGLTERDLYVLAMPSILPKVIALTDTHADALTYAPTTD